MDLKAQQLGQRLSELGHQPDLVILKATTHSTNDDVRALISPNVDSILVSSEMQTQGRGQHQRQWISPPGNIYLSALVNTQKNLDGRLALEVALNILDMPSLRDLALYVKWPNDLYSARAKLGGILVEPINPKQAIVGVGLNLITPDHQDATQPISSLNELVDKNFDRDQLIIELYQAIMQAGQWFDHGSYRLKERFNHRAMFLNQQVEFESFEQLYHGRFAGISAEGAVILNTDQGQLEFYQGRLRLLKAKD